MGKQQRRCSMMSLLSLLATTTLVGLAQAGPLARTSSHNAAIQSLQIPVDRDRFLLILLVNQKDFVAEGKSMEDMLEYLNEHDTGTTSNEADSNVSSSSSNGRDKRMGSLSIVNSVDVLRQRVLLELARRKAMEDQRQISENRRLLDSVGKRSSYPGSSIMARKKDSSAADSSLEHDQLQRQFDELMMQ
ncbi:diuretic hormone 44 [Trichogramma pretiosum]|uniref:diuretic hormone 44 n=1 Tax=Trichogramma pretiosum TaxID=7493 RepID=UPI0006C95470|nr:diuretic hormone 44 [Trichogramma pretiosum]